MNNQLTNETRAATTNKFETLTSMEEESKDQGWFNPKGDTMNGKLLLKYPQMLLEN